MCFDAEMQHVQSLLKRQNAGSEQPTEENESDVAGKNNIPPDSYGSFGGRH
jgi:hypothetical protein